MAVRIVMRTAVVNIGEHIRECLMEFELIVIGMEGVTQNNACILWLHFLHKHSQFAKCFVSAKTCYYLANIMTLVLTIATKCGGEYWLVNIKPVQVGWRTSNNATSNSIKLSMVCSPPVYLLWRLSLPIYQHNTVIINVSVDLCQFGIFSTSLLTRKQ